MNVAVVGAGIFGLAAALELRQRGYAVTVFEQGSAPNERASSTDVAKTIRRLYGDSETYVELAERAAPQWQRWHERLGRAIYFPVGQLEIIRGFAPGDRIYESWRFLQRRGAGVQVLPRREARERFPQFAYGDDDTVVYDAWGGYLASGRAVAGLAGLARADGVEIREGARVAAVEESAAGVGVQLAGGLSRFDRAVVAAGVWLDRLVPQIGRHLRATRQQMAFFEPADPRPFAPGTMPVWGVDPDVDGWYGHPLLAEGFVKVANDLRGEVVDADVDRQVSPAFLELARAFVARRLPELAKGRLVGGRTCLYENTPDHDFVIDWAPGCSRVLVAGGGSGHGFKFGGAIGAVIADALEDKANRLGDRFRIGTRFDAPPD